MDVPTFVMQQQAMNILNENSGNGGDPKMFLAFYIALILCCLPGSIISIRRVYKDRNWDEFYTMSVITMITLLGGGFILALALGIYIIL